MCHLQAIERKRKKRTSLAKNSTYRTSSIRCQSHYDTFLCDTIQELCSFPWKLLDINNGMYVQATHNPWAIESFVLPGRHSTSLQLTTMQQLIATLVHAASQSYCKPWNMHTNSLGASLVTVNSIISIWVCVPHLLAAATIWGHCLFDLVQCLTCTCINTPQIIDNMIDVIRLLTL